MAKASTPKSADETAQTDEEYIAALEKENDDLRAENARLREEREDEQVVPQPNTRPKPHRPSFGMSEGERADLEQHGVTNSPFTGERLTASGEGVEPANADARKADERANRDKS